MRPPGASPPVRPLRPPGIGGELFPLAPVDPPSRFLHCTMNRPTATSTRSSSSTPSTWPHADSASRYGTVSRVLHWGMALCFAIVFAAALAHYFVRDSALESALWPLHKPTGAPLIPLPIPPTP